MNGHILLFALLMAFVTARPMRPKGEDLFESYPTNDFIPVDDGADKFVEIQYTPTKFVNMSLADFTKVASANRDVYNDILRTLGVNNTTLFEYNPLLRGLDESKYSVVDYFPPSWNNTLKGNLFCTAKYVLKNG